ncbi:MAG: RNA polymerase sigma-70 factor [Bacteroidota bacterium]
MENTDSTCQQSSFKKLYDAYSGGLRNFVYYRFADTAFAEDAVQEAFIRLWKNCASVPYEKAKSYLFTVANNMVLDRVKHQKVRLKFRARPTKTADVEDPEYLLQVKEFHEKLQNAINELPDHQREVFLLNRIDKMKYREIAVHLGISQKAVEKRMHKALLIWRGKIGKIK